MANAGRHLYASQNLNQLPQQYEGLPLSLLSPRESTRLRRKQQVIASRFPASPSFGERRAR